MDHLAFDEAYYRGNQQDRDRPALWFYERIARRYIRRGTVVDYGCGTGYFLRRLQRSFEAIGYEPSAYARAQAAGVCPGARLVSDMDQIALESLSGVVALHVFEHVGQAEIAAVLASLRSRLKRDGTLLAVMPDPGGLAHQLKGKRWIGFTDPTHVNLRSAAEWRLAFDEAGFRVVAAGTDGLWDFPYPFARWRLVNNAIHRGLTGGQFALARLVLAEGRGESSVLVLEKR